MKKESYFEDILTNLLLSACILVIISSFLSYFHVQNIASSLIAIIFSTYMPFHGFAKKRKMKFKIRKTEIILLFLFTLGFVSRILPGVYNTYPYGSNDAMHHLARVNFIYTYGGIPTGSLIGKWPPYEEAGNPDVFIRDKFVYPFGLHSFVAAIAHFLPPHPSRMLFVLTFFCSLFIIPVYYLCLAITRNETSSIVAAFLAAISMKNHIGIVDGIYAHAATVFTTTLFFYFWLKKRKIKYLFPVMAATTLITPLGLLFLMFIMVPWFLLKLFSGLRKKDILVFAATLLLSFLFSSHLSLAKLGSEEKSTVISRLLEPMKKVNYTLLQLAIEPFIPNMIIQKKCAWTIDKDFYNDPRLAYGYPWLVAAVLGVAALVAKKKRNAEENFFLSFFALSFLLSRLYIPLCLLGTFDRVAFFSGRYSMNLVPVYAVAAGTLFCIFKQKKFRLVLAVLFILLNINTPIFLAKEAKLKKDLDEYDYELIGPIGQKNVGVLLLYPEKEFVRFKARLLTAASMNMFWVYEKPKIENSTLFLKEKEGVGRNTMEVGFVVTPKEDVCETKEYCTKGLEKIRDAGISLELVMENKRHAVYKVS